MHIIKNCPFCRGRAELEGAAYAGPADCWDTLVRCTECEACGPTVLGQHGDDQETRCDEAVAGWNGRAPGVEDFSDEILHSIVNAQRHHDAIQGFDYSPRYVIRNVLASWQNQVIWSIEQSVDNSEALFRRQCDIEALRHALSIALGTEQVSAQKTA